ncbi:MAG: RES family NAD+ phosphorylase [Sphingomonadales bacterium]|nr:RES family NAD+ phosphorylase [Sphingomonadales bacterium]
MIAYDGPVWRLLTEQLVGSPTTPAAAPEGRFHHSGQIAAYASLTAEGAEVAIKRYLTDNRKRLLVPMWLKAEAVADVRGNVAASVVWQDQRQSGAIPSTWAISDAARREGAEALLYSSRSRPELSHVVVFDPACLSLVGPITPMAAFDP